MKICAVDCRLSDMSTVVSVIASCTDILQEWLSDQPNALGATQPTISGNCTSVNRRAEGYGVDRLSEADGLRGTLYWPDLLKTHIRLGTKSEPVRD